MTPGTPPPSGDELAERMARAGLAALEIGAQTVLGAGQREAPVKEGTLRGSGHIETFTSGNAVAKEVVFSTPYAARQHEETTWEHPKGGKSKYLEDPLKELIPRVETLVAAVVRKAF